MVYAQVCLSTCHVPVRSFSSYYVKHVFKMQLCVQVVSDQVRLWQADTQRVRHQKAVLYDSFPTQQIYQLAATFAQNHGWLLWQNDEQGRFVSQAGGHDQMRVYIKSIR